MAVKIRLARRGKKRYAMYDVVVADSRSPRDGRFIEKIGIYNPNTNPATVNLDEAKAFKWVMNGAVPTDTVKAMLSYRGILFKKHLQVGVLKGAITQEQADAKFNAWIESKNAKIQGKVDTLAQSKKDLQKSRLEAEAKVKEDRAKAIAEKQKVQVEATTEETTETPVEENNNNTAAE
ncbi:MAG: 30S ribosomal protein S16 [Thermonemataceae bacterium]|nr:30S ribosomal protein S16 [Thermonemataceae bacterium]